MPEELLNSLRSVESHFTTGTGGIKKKGFEGLSNQKSNPKRVWNKIPEEEKEKVVAIALERSEETPRQLAWHITDRYGYYISESSVYRILKSYDLVPSPKYFLRILGYRKSTRNNLTINGKNL